MKCFKHCSNEIRYKSQKRHKGLNTRSINQAFYAYAQRTKTWAYALNILSSFLCENRHKKLPAINPAENRNTKITSKSRVFGKNTKIKPAKAAAKAENRNTKITSNIRKQKDKNYTSSKGRIRN